MTTTAKKTPARRRPAAPPQGHVPPTFQQMRERIQRPRDIVDMVMDAEAAAEIGALEDLLERAQRHDEASDTETALEVAKRLQEVEASAEASRVRFVLQAIPHRTYQTLRAQHPPTKDQIEKAARLGAQGDPAFDPDSFAPTLVQAQLIEPQPPEDPDEFAGFWDDLSDGQLIQLWTAALGVQFQSGELGPSSQTATDVLRSFGLTTD